MQSLTLPEPIANYFASEHHPEAMKQCFAEHAILKDNGRTYEGAGTIADFLEAAAIKYKSTTVPFDLKDDGSFQVVRAKVTGEFDGSPVNLAYRFGLDRGLIKSLEITQ